MIYMYIYIYTRYKYIYIYILGTRLNGIKPAWVWPKFRTWGFHKLPWYVNALQPCTCVAAPRMRELFCEIYIYIYIYIYTTCIYIYMYIIYHIYIYMYIHGKIKLCKNNEIPNLWMIFLYIFPALNQQFVRGCSSHVEWHQRVLYLNFHLDHPKSKPWWSSSTIIN